jgi:predicted phosphoadenosine phosphosulfate sulfurtransferase
MLIGANPVIDGIWVLDVWCMVMENLVHYNQNEGQMVTAGCVSNVMRV